MLSNKYICFFIFAFIASFVTFSFAQSTETGTAFNKYMSPEGGVNPLSGSAAFTKPLAVMSVGALNVTYEMIYSGNVFEVVKNKNDIAQTSWVGLGWSLGQAKIISDDAGSMWLGDDSYYLVTPAGLKYKIFYERNRWWIENLPYWKVEQKVYTKNFNGKSYTIIKGWKLTDISGIKYYYGDIDDSDIKIERNATEYTLANPNTYGIVGALKNGVDKLFPTAWNLSKQEDYNQNNITYTYDQVEEKVKIAGHMTTNGYTKECYLKKVKSSSGASIEFFTEAKGSNLNFQDEFIDNTGEPELTSASAPDAFIDPLERRYLSKITINGNDGKKLEDIAFCYRPLRVRINGQDNSKYVKRLLSSITFLNKNSEKMDEETYEYYDYSQEKTSSSSEASLFTQDPEKIPLGAIKSITGKNCGKIEYKYKEMTIVDQDADGLHSDVLPINNINLGSLEDGTVYAVGFTNKESKLQIYFRRNGKWLLQQTIDDVVQKSNSGSFFIGEKNWFISVIDNDPSESDENRKDYTYTVFLWNGRNWEKQKSFRDTGSRDYLAFGPNYVVKAKVEDEKIVVSIPWALWKKDGYEISKYKADDDAYDRTHTQLFAAKNHFGLFYKDKGNFNSGHLKMFSFAYDRSRIEQTNDWDDLDDDNQYGFLNDKILICAEESRGVWSYYARVLEWNESEAKWEKKELMELNGWQGEPSIQVVGDDYFAIKHNDFDDMSLFEFNGNSWKTVYDNENMVDHQNFDWSTEAEWFGYSSGADFYIVTRPRIKKHWYGNKVKPNRKVQVIKRDEESNWSMSESHDYGLNNRKHILVGTDWYVVREPETAYVWNGFDWKIEDMNKKSDGSSNSIDLESSNNEPRSLLGEYIVYGANKNRIIFKKNDSFKDKVVAYFVDEKKVSDPVVDKVISYSYHYAGKLSSEYPKYDYATGMPIVDAYRIDLPNNRGEIENILCNNSGVAQGEVCIENTYRNITDVFPIKKVSKSYYRYRGPDDAQWPGLIYVDRLSENKIENFYPNSSANQASPGKNIIEDMTYLDDVNGLVKSKKIFIDGKALSETINVYAPERYTFMLDSNRLSEAIASYQCISKCDDGKLVSGSAVRYTEENDDANSARKTFKITDKWVYAPSKERSSTFTFDWSSDSQPSEWKKVQSYTSYQNGVANESVDAFGVKTALIYENKLSGRLVASVSNAGIDEILVLPGETCNIKNWNPDRCDIKNNFLGNAVDELGATAYDPVDYSRFSSKAVVITSANSLDGSINKAKGGNYRFSAWVQGVAKTSVKKNLQLYLNGSLKKNFPVFGFGKWEYIEWETDLTKGASYTLKLDADDESEIRLQDIRFVPSDAITAVSFWDEHLSLPNVQLNDRSIASYIRYDADGRVIETYGETDVPNEECNSESAAQCNYERKIVLTKRNAYINGSCLDPTVNNTALSRLTINGFNLQVLPNEPINFVVKNNYDVLHFSWETVQKGEPVSYWLHKPNETEENWINTCCSTLEGVTQKYDGSALVLEIYVGENYTKRYKINISRSTSGWIDYGHYLTEGSKPTYLSNAEISKLDYITSDGLKEAIYDGVSWTGYDTDKQAGIYKTLGSAGNVQAQYVFALPDYTGEYSSSSSSCNAQSFIVSTTAWSPADVLTKSSTSSNKYHITSNSNGIPYLIFEKKEVSTGQSVSVEKNGISEAKAQKIESKALVAEKFVFGHWVDAGTIATESVLDADVTIGPNNVPYVAYIGTIPSKNHTEKFLMDVDEFPDDDIAEGTDIPPEYFKEVSVADKYVIIKHLSSTGGQNNWTGFSSSEGDCLVLDGAELLNADKVKLVSDGTNIYMAVRYEQNETGKYAFSVFKLIGQGASLAFNVLEDQFVHSKIIAYMEENSPFDLAVYNDVPYLMFANESNNNQVSVITYTSNRWLSVGNPAFASIASGESAADLAVNTSGMPFVVFKERYDSKNSLRRNKIVPMKYSADRDKDITLSSIGDAGVSCFSSDFRQYILNYSATVSEDLESIDFDLKLNKQKDVDVMEIENNGVNVFTWTNRSLEQAIKWISKTIVNSLGRSSSDDHPKTTISLKNGYNDIHITTIGTDGSRLTYTFVVYREYEHPLNAVIADVAGNKALLTESSKSTMIESDGQQKSIYDLTYEIGSDSKTKTICFEFSSSWDLIINKILFGKNVCLNMDLKTNTVIYSSSSSSDGVSLSSSSSNSDSGVSSSSSSLSGNIRFVDNDGNEIIVNIVPIVVSSSSSSSDGAEGSDPYSSSSNNSGIGQSSSSSQIKYNGTIINNTGIPEEYYSIYGYKLVSINKLTFADWSKGSGGYYIANSAEVGANANITGRLYSAGDIQLRSNSYIENLITSGNLEMQDGATYGSLQQASVNVPALVTKGFDIGTEDVNVWNNQSQTMEPGKYKNLHIYSNSVVTFEPGAYYFESFIIEPDVTILFENGSSPIQLWVQGTISFADRLQTVCKGNDTKLFIYGNTASSLYLGVTSALSATLILPNGNVNIAPYSIWTGSIWANSITIQANAAIK